VKQASKNKPVPSLRIGRGILGGRKIHFEATPDLRPTLSQVREAVFSMIAPNAESFGFVDACSGSGIMALEAASMGFSPVVSIEPHQPSLKRIKAHFQVMAVHALFFQQSVLAIDSFGLARQKWVFYADPPYLQSSLHSELLPILSQAAFVEPGSLYIAESEDQAPTQIPAGWTTLKRRRYGRACLWVGIKD